MVEATTANANTLALLNAIKSGTDNTQRQQAEEQMTGLRKSNSDELKQGLMSVVIAADVTDAGVKALGCLLFKKYYLDDREEEKECA